MPRRLSPPTIERFSETGDGMICEIRLKGRAGRTIATAFDDFEISTGTSDTLLRGDLADQAALYGVLDRIQRLGLELLDVHVAEPGFPPGGPGGPRSDGTW
jgi:hypothetical protein